VAHWLLAGLAGQRGQDAASLRRALPASVSASEHDTVAAAVDAARQRPGISRVLVFGSFHTVAEAADALAVDLE
jgi:dihydrofolate synthase/folylpolyglutamate synthase